MTTKEYLMQAVRLKRCADDKAEQINSLRSLLTSISVNTSDVNVQSSSDHDKMAGLIANILDRESELRITMDEYLKIERVIASQIDSIENPVYKHVLYSKYIRG